MPTIPRNCLRFTSAIVFSVTVFTNYGLTEPFEVASLLLLIHLGAKIIPAFTFCLHSHWLNTRGSFHRYIQIEPMSKEKQLKRGRSDEDGAVETNSINESEIKDLLVSLSSKMDSLSNAISDVDKRLNIKMDCMESSLSSMIRDVKEDMDKRFSSFSTEVDHRFQMAAACSDRKTGEITAEVANVSKRVDELSAMHEVRIDKLERSSMDKELIISGVPLENHDNPLGIIGDICRALNCNLNDRDFTAAYRLKIKNGNAKQSVPIVVKVYDNFAKQELLSCYFKRKDLNLKDIGFQTSSRIFINESLTKSNRAIFNLASEAKKANLITKFFSRNGLVHVQRDENGRPYCIYHVGELQQILPPTFERASSYTSQNKQPLSRSTTSSVNKPQTSSSSAGNSQLQIDGKSSCSLSDADVMITPSVPVNDGNADTPMNQ